MKTLTPIVWLIHPFSNLKPQFRMTVPELVVECQHAFANASHVNVSQIRWITIYRIAWTVASILILISMNYWTIDFFISFQTKHRQKQAKPTQKLQSLTKNYNCSSCLCCNHLYRKSNLFLQSEGAKCESSWFSLKVNKLTGPMSASTHDSVWSEVLIQSRRTVSSSPTPKVKNKLVYIWTIFYYWFPYWLKNTNRHLCLQDKSRIVHCRWEYHIFHPLHYIGSISIQNLFTKKWFHSLKRFIGFAQEYTHWWTQVPKRKEQLLISFLSLWKHLSKMTDNARDCCMYRDRLCGFQTQWCFYSLQSDLYKLFQNESCGHKSHGSSKTTVLKIYDVFDFISFPLRSIHSSAKLK